MFIYIQEILRIKLNQLTFLLSNYICASLSFIFLLLRQYLFVPLYSKNILHQNFIIDNQQFIFLKPYIIYQSILQELV
ncbi:hypothetical protein pb186bvf_001144 [Paramecium bursaria]